MTIGLPLLLKIFEKHNIRRLLVGWRLQMTWETRARIWLEAEMHNEGTEFYGRVENGVVVLERPEELAEGTYVCVTPVKTDYTLGQRLLEFAGTIEGLPPDMASNHDHYIHGTPKK